MLLLQLLINGLQLGAIYALTAVGFCADLRLDAHLPRRARRGVHDRGVPVLVVVHASCTGTGWPALVLATAAVIAFGVAMERWIYRPIQRHEGAFFTVFIAAFGMQIVVQNAVGTIFGRGFETVTVALSRALPSAPGLVRRAGRRGRDRCRAGVLRRPGAGS